MVTLATIIMKLAPRLPGPLATRAVEVAFALVERAMRPPGAKPE